MLLKNKIQIKLLVRQACGKCHLRAVQAGTHRLPTTLCGKEHRGPRDWTQSQWKQEESETSGSQRSGEEPAIRNTSKNNLVRPPPHRMQSRTVFFEADSEHPVHLSQLILRAGDVKENPCPHWCGICDQKVTSNCIKYTWCERWIHQKCSGLTKQDIKQFAKAKQFAYECDKCSPLPPFHPGGESLEDEPRGYQTCVHPAQEPTSTDGIQRWDSTAPELHPDLESSPA